MMLLYHYTGDYFAFRLQSHMVPELDAASRTRMSIRTKNDDNSPPIPQEDVIKLSYLKATRREGMVQDKTSMVNIVKMMMIKARQRNVP